MGGLCQAVGHTTGATDPRAWPRAATGSWSCLWIVNREVCCPRTRKVQALRSSSLEPESWPEGSSEWRGLVWQSLCEIQRETFQTGCAHVCGEEEAWAHPAACSGLVLFGVSFHTPFLIWGQAILNKKIHFIVPQGPRISPSPSHPTTNTMHVIGPCRITWRGGQRSGDQKALGLHAVVR